MRAGAPGAIAAAVAWAAGTWAALGTVAIPPSGTSARLGVLPPLWILLLLAGAGVAIAVTLRLDGRGAAPMFLALIACLPWLPGTVPAPFMILAGPLALVPVGAGLVGVMPWERWRVRIRGTTRAHLTAAGLVLAVLSVLAAWRMAPVLPGGDEPHYLIIAESLLHDGDLRIENNHGERNYLAFSDGELRPDYLRRGRDGAIYSIHAPGLAVLLLPAYAAAGYPGAVLLLATLMALGSLLAWRAAHAVTADRGAAWVGWAAVTLSVPFFFQTFTIYPDGPAALVVAYVAWSLVSPKPPGLGGLVLVGAGLAALPWLHTRYALLSVAAALVVIGHIVVPSTTLPGGRSAGSLVRRLGALLAIPLASCVLWLLFFHAIYGTFDPRAPYGGATDLHMARIPHGLAGLLIDQQFGLIPNAPIFLVAAVGLMTLARTRRRLALELGTLAVPYVLAVAAFHMWWAGHSSPARFLVPVLLPLAMPVAAWWHRHDSRVPRTSATLLLAGSLGLTLVFAWANRGAFVYNTRDGFATWLDAAAPSVNLARALPSLFQAGVGGALALGLAWASILAVSWLLLGRLDRWVIARGPWLLWTGVTATAATLAGAILGWAVGAGPVLEPGSSAVRLAARLCRGDGVGVSVGRPAPLATTAVTSGLVIPDAWRRPLGAGGPLWGARDLPPGQYAVRLDSPTPATGTLSISLGRLDQVLARCALNDVRPGTSDCRLDLPGGAAALWLVGDATLLGSAPRVSLEVMNLGPAASCELRAGRAVTSPSVTLFVVGGRVYGEHTGAWVEGGREGRFVARSAEPELRVRLRNGPRANTVRIASGGWHDEVALVPGEVRQVSVPAGTAGAVVPLVVAPSVGFRPADVDRTSRDVRWLGVWVEGT